MDRRVCVHRSGAVGADQGVTRLFYDGDCGFCGRMVRFVAKHDQTRRIRFAPLGGETFAKLVSPEAKGGLPDSLVVLTAEGDLLTQSRAVIHLLHRMGPGWHLLGTLLAHVSEDLRAWGYRSVARWRHRAGSCPRPANPGDTRFES